MDEAARRRRAEERRRRATLQWAPPGVVEPDPHPVAGAEAISLVTRLTRESWSLSGLPWPEYARADTPYRFVPRPE